MNCPVCNEENKGEVYLNFSYVDIDYHLVNCTNCGSLYYLNDINYDYRNNEDQNRSLKIYLEKTADIETLITVTYNFFTSIIDSPRLGIEIGCGSGLVMDFIQSHLNIEVTGFEPSQLYCREARSLFNINVVEDFFYEGNIVKRKSDFVLSFQVLQLIKDPYKILVDINNHLAENGTLLISIPDYTDFLKNPNLSGNFSILSPGVNTVLFSKKGIELLFKRAGFQHVLILENVNQLFIVASQQKFEDLNLFQPRPELLTSYYKQKLETAPKNSSFYKGIWYRFFRNRIDLGLYSEALELAKNATWLIVSNEDEINQINNEDKLYDLNSFADAIIYYYSGILFLNYINKPAFAEKLFSLSFLLCKKIIQFQKGMSAIEEDIVWLAKLHIAIAKINLGKSKEARDELISFFSVEQIGYRDLPDIPKHLLERADILLKSLS